MYPLLQGLLQVSDTDPLLKKEIEEVLAKLNTIRNLTDGFVKIARQKNIPLYYSNDSGVDDDIFGWLPSATVSSVAFPKGTWTPADTKNGTTEKEMLKTAQKMCLSQAVQSFTAELEAGTFDALSTYRIIFLEETDAQGNSLRLVCGRSSGGELGLYVDQVRPGRRWCDAGSAWLATNA
jgi:hypothetical protein